MIVFWQALVSGIAVGVIYALIALGFNIIFQTTRIINFAQGEFVMIGALAGYSLTVVLGLPILLALVGVALISALVGVLTERMVMAPIQRSTYRYSWIITTLAVAIILRNLMGTDWLYGREDYRVPPLVSGVFFVGPVVVAYQQVIIFIIALLLLVLIELFYQRTFLGKAIRATAFNYNVASLMGIPVPMMIQASFAMSAAVSGIAGVLVAPLIFANVSMGILIGLKGFVAIILGGLGSPRGAVIGGLIVGLLDTTVRVLAPEGWGNFIVFGILALVLLIRPGGLFGKPDSRH
ncbi:branched-chain amino acid ABC transporter permease [Roseiflexus sp.]|uniref:branched-chain amino acid ABC transporter permease n=1 Tax=Roseiflexus sp. TaxID=2562120 RepID=UPI00398AF8A4